MTRYKKFLLIILIAPTVIKPHGSHDYDDYSKKLVKEFKYKHPYLYFNILIIAGMIKGLSFFADLETKSVFKDAPASTVEEIKKLAKELGFSDEHIAKISVKKPRKYNDFDTSFLNNYAAFFDTVIIGRQNIDILKKLDQDPGAKKFTYGHELSHVKYAHVMKKIWAIIISPVVIELGARSLSTVLCNMLLNMKEDYNNNNRSLFYNQTREQAACNKLFDLSIKCTHEFLNSYVTKLIVQVIFFISMGRKFEKDADMGAASLGPDAIEGGIKSFEAYKQLREERNAAIVSRFSNPVVKTFVKCLLAVKGFFRRLLDVHPSDETRIKYLKAKLQELQKTQPKPA